MVFTWVGAERNIYALQFLQETKGNDLEVIIVENILPHISKFKHIGSILQNDEEVNEQVTRKI